MYGIATKTPPGQEEKSIASLVVPTNERGMAKRQPESSDTSE
jgi:hypothetical protein